MHYRKAKACFHKVPIAENAIEEEKNMQDRAPGNNFVSEALKVSCFDVTLMCKFNVNYMTLIMFTYQFSMKNLMVLLFCQKYVFSIKSNFIILSHAT